MAATSNLSALLRPRSVAVVGASRRPGSIGGAVLANLLAGGFQGPIYPVNRSASHVHSIRAYPDLDALPEAPELIIVAVPAAEVLEVIRSAIRKGVKAACILTANFGETAAGRERQRELVTLARSAGLRILGPNCLGLQNADPEIRLDASFAATFAPDGPVAFASQSGALGLAVLDYAAELGLGLSSFLSLGNKADVSSNDLLEYWATDPRTRLVLLYLESVGNSTRFREIAARVGRTKPIAMVKSGRSRAGARAAGSHTGAMASPDAWIDALSRQAGILRADTLEELFDVAMILANQPLPRGRRVAVVTNAGGPGILAADALEAAGLPLASFAPETLAGLARTLRPEASFQNPVDILADAPPAAFREALRLVLADPNTDAVLALHVPPITSNAEAMARAIVETGEGAQKPILSCFMGTHGVPESLRSLHAGHIPSFRFPEGAARALSRAVAYAEWRAAPPALPEPVPAPPAEAIASLTAARARLGAEGGWLSNAEVAALCTAWRIPLAEQAVVAPDSEVVVAAAQRIGFPVVLKAEKPGLVHKTEAGGVVLGVENAGAVRAAVTRLRKLEPTGILVQRQLRGDEWLVGAVRDPLYGPLVTVGAGGTRTELLRDVEQRLAPLSRVDVDALLDRPHVGKLLHSWRGQPPRDRAALADCVRRFAQLACAHPELTELEANPVVVGYAGEGAAAIDLRAKLGPLRVA